MAHALRPQVEASGVHLGTTALRAAAVHTLGVPLAASTASRAKGLADQNTAAHQFYAFQALPAGLEDIKLKTGAFTALETHPPDARARRRFRRSIIVLREPRVRVRFCFV